MIFIDGINLKDTILITNYKKMIRRIIQNFIGNYKYYLFLFYIIFFTENTFFNCKYSWQYSNLS